MPFYEDFTFEIIVEPLKHIHLKWHFFQFKTPCFSFKEISLKKFEPIFLKKMHFVKTIIAEKKNQVLKVLGMLFSFFKI